MSPDTSTGLRILDNCKPLWRRPDDDVAGSVIIPALRVSTDFACMVGFFGGGALRELAPGLADFITRSKKPFRLLASPILTDDDQEAIRLATGKPEQILADAIASSFADPVALTSALAKHTTRCLAYLLASERLQMKVVLVEGALFHLKEWIFSDQADTAVLSGSANFTGRALTKNVEQFSLHRSWRGEDALLACADSVREFEHYWNNQKSHAIAVTLPKAVKDRLLASYHSDPEPPSEADYQRALRAEGADPWPPLSGSPQQTYHIPSAVVYESGAFAHQGEAVASWEASARKGILSMATGSGKTITAYIAGYRLYAETGSLLLIIACPTRPLVDQWEQEGRLFGLTPTNTSEMGRGARLEATDSAVMNLELELSRCEVLVVTHDLLVDHDFLSLITKYKGPSLLVADEVHNLGSSQFLERTPNSIAYRLGLSATPIRQYDAEGTAGLIAYFGEVAFEFGLDKAIGVCLVPYDYHIHLVALDDQELEAYKDLTERIRLAFLISQSSGSSDDEARLQLLLNRRRLILETAHGKIESLRAALLKMNPRDVANTLVYATDKDPQQLLEVNSLLTEMGIRFAQVTAAETGRAGLVEALLADFERGELQVLTAKRVLDEGLNIPQIHTALILASTTVERQWIQRRGRVLRMSPGKDHAVIHDFVVMPPDNVPRDSDAVALVRGEVKRCEEFTRLARNRASLDGPRDVVQELKLRYLV